MTSARPCLQVALTRHTLSVAALATLALVARAQQLQPPPPPPPGNPTTPNKVLLGKALFWDEQLSSTKTVACATQPSPRNQSTPPSPAHAVSGPTSGLARFAGSE